MRHVCIVMEESPRYTVQAKNEYWDKSISYSIHRITLGGHRKPTAGLPWWWGKMGAAQGTKKNT